MSLAQAEDLMKQHRPADALDRLSDVIRAQPNLLRARLLAAVAHTRLGNNAEAIDNLEVCAANLGRAQHPVKARLNLARYFADANAIDRADALLAEAMKLDPRNIEVIAKRADINNNAGHWAEALKLYDKALGLAPGHPALLASSAVAAHTGGETAEAVKRYIAALSAEPSMTGLYSNLLAALLALGRKGEALDWCRKWRQLTPGSIESMAFEALLLQENGMAEEAGRWLDYDRFVTADMIGVPDGYSSLDAFNRELEGFVLGQPDLAMPPEDHPTWHHRALRIGSLIGRMDTGCAAALGRLMEQAVERYFARSDASDGHPFLVHRPADYHINAWSAVLDGEGNQQPHIHFDGYLSGCYYVTIPDEVSSQDQRAGEPVAGGFEAGRPPVELDIESSFPTRVIKPEEGLMVLFPAYLYHATIPFKSDKRRISIAFDVVPGRRPAAA